MTRNQFVSTKHQEIENLHGCKVDQRPHHKFLKVQEWTSNYPPVNNLLLYLMRKSKSEASRRLYLRNLFKFCEYTGKKPNELVKLRRDRAEKLVQDFADKIMGTSPRYSNLAIATLKAFFASNGFKGIRALQLETYHTPRRFRKSHEYIPTKSEVYRMADSAGSLRDRAIILTLFSTGLRNSTLRAILYSDIAEELNQDFANIMVPVYPEMKTIVPNACKGRVPYYTFTNEEASQAIKLYIRERLEKYSSIEDDEPLFTSEYNHISKDERRKKILTPRQLQLIVKSAAKKAGIQRWQAVHPHCLRKSFETVVHSQLIDRSNLDNEIQLFLIGHVLPGSQDPYFDSSKPDRLRVQYSKLKFGRAIIENKFKVLKTAVARAFEDTDIDPEQAIEEYVKMKHMSSS